MTCKTFEIKSYKIVLGDTLKSTWDKTISAKAVISCESQENDKFFIYFLDDISPVATPVYDPEKKIAAIFLPKDELPLFTDLLRNECPMYAFCDSENPHSMCIRTTKEPVGEAEYRV